MNGVTELEAAYARAVAAQLRGLPPLGASTTREVQAWRRGGAVAAREFARAAGEAAPGRFDAPAWHALAGLAPFQPWHASPAFNLEAERRQLPPRELQRDLDAVVECPACAAVLGAASLRTCREHGDLEGNP